MIFLLYIAIILFANRESLLDYTKISAHQKIDHISSWIYRATFALVIIFLIPNTTLFDKFLLSIAVAFLFSAIFRFRLNGRRKKPLRYISTSNIYDSIFIKLFPKNHGTLIYLIEMTIFIISTILYLL